MKHILATLAVILLFFSCGNFARAEIKASDVDIAVAPENPSPFQEITVDLSSFNVDLDNAQISWSVNGKSVLSGLGKKKLSATLGDIGSAFSVSAKITGGGSTIIKNMSITPAAIDILWEAPDTYVPPFYKGKALPGSEALIRVFALPSAKLGNQSLRPSDFTYSWSRNYNAVPEASGYAKNVYVFSVKYVNPTELIKVSAGGVGVPLSGEGSIELKAVQPAIHFYRSDPAFGVLYNRAIDGTATFEGDEETISAEPYFISPANLLSGDLSYSWTINGKSVIAPKEKHLFTLRKEGAQSGTAKIGLTIENLKTLFQKVSANLSLNY